MSLIHLVKINEAFYQVKTESGISYEIRDFFSFRPKNYQFNPRFKAKQWDGYVRMFNPIRPAIHAGLVDLLRQFCSDRGYELKITGDEPPIDATYESIKAFGKSLNLHSDGNPIELYDHQIKYIVIALRERKCILLSPTASGKSLVLYVLIRYLLANNLSEKILLSVPTTSLVDQMYSDFEDYSSENKWNASKFCRKIRGGLEKKLDMPVTISTWQSIYSMPKEWFGQIDSIMVDEAHTAQAKSLTHILENATNAWFRVGLTGTIDDAESHKLTLTAVLGTAFRVITTSEMIDKGMASDLKIKAVRLVYDDYDKKTVSKMTYEEQLDFIIAANQRQEVIGSILDHVKGNSLVLFNKISHGKTIFEFLRNRYPNRNVYYIAGEVSVEKREEFRKKVDKDDGAIIVASFGTFQAGINIKNLNNLIFAHPGKAKIRILQSIGRGLRKATNGLGTVIFDLVDDLSWKSTIAYSINHAAERFRYYAEEKFKVSTVNFKMKRILS